LAVHEKRNDLTEQPAKAPASLEGEGQFDARTDAAGCGPEDNIPYENSLKKFYQDGRHICPMAFGEERSEGCLFCAAMLARGEI
jgi:regulator of replication initiation timing